MIWNDYSMITGERLVSRVKQPIITPPSGTTHYISGGRGQVENLAFVKYSIWREGGWDTPEHLKIGYLEMMYVFLHSDFGYK